MRCIGNVHGELDKTIKKQENSMRFNFLSTIIAHVLVAPLLAHPKRIFEAGGLEE
jgi:hypothetical protein